MTTDRTDLAGWQPTPDGYKHAEAFCLMWYACECGHRERIWNSRDGVTPFGLACPSCGKPSLRHVEWRSDERRPEHKPPPGQRFFCDGSADDAVRAIERRIAIFTERGQPIPSEVVEQLMRDAREQTGEWLPGWPVVRRQREA
jgi:hypothetical protein